MSQNTGTALAVNGDDPFARLRTKALDNQGSLQPPQTCSTNRAEAQQQDEAEQMRYAWNSVSTVRESR
jgi:hypothetical protein